MPVMAEAGQPRPLRITVLNGAVLSLRAEVDGVAW